MTQGWPNGSEGIIPAEHCILSGFNIPEHIQAAKDFIAYHELTKDHVKLIAREELLMVYTIRPIRLKPGIYNEATERETDDANIPIW